MSEQNNNWASKKTKQNMHALTKIRGKFGEKDRQFRENWGKLSFFFLKNSHDFCQCV